MTAGGFLEGPEGLLALPEPSGQWLFASGLALIFLLGRGRLRSWKTGYVLVIEAREGVRKWDV
jgi:hypothetical protein